MCQAPPASNGPGYTHPSEPRTPPQQLAPDLTASLSSAASSAVTTPLPPHPAALAVGSPCPPLGKNTHPPLSPADAYFRLPDKTIWAAYEHEKAAHLRTQARLAEARAERADSIRLLKERPDHLASETMGLLTRVHALEKQIRKLEGEMEEAGEAAQAEVKKEVARRGEAVRMAEYAQRHVERLGKENRRVRGERDKAVEEALKLRTENEDYARVISLLQRELQSARQNPTNRR
jgi:hypothetical protein